MGKMITQEDEMWPPLGLKLLLDSLQGKMGNAFWVVSLEEKGRCYSEFMAVSVTGPSCSVL